MLRRIPFFILLFTLVLASCHTQPATQGQATAQSDSSLRVLATTTIVGDVVRQVGGDLIVLDVLLPVGSDPHAFEPAPKDAIRIAQADLIFANGAGLETFLERLLASANSQTRVIYVSEGIPLLTAEEAHKHESEDHDEHPGGDPHVWFDPNNVLVWVDNIEKALSQLDPAHATTYQANAQHYREQLQQLDAWIREQVAQLPLEDRKIVTDHLSFAYFAQRYVFTQVGAAIPGYSTLAEPSAQELAALEDAIRNMNVRAIFVGSTVNPALAERIAQDTGIRLAFLYTGSLGPPGSGAETYLDYMRYNVRTIVNALKSPQP